MTIEDSWGGDITTAAIAHLAHSTPTEYLFTSTDFNSYVTVSTAGGAPAGRRPDGGLAIEPGLGIAPRMDVLGQPAVVKSHRENDFVTQPCLEPEPMTRPFRIALVCAIALPCTHLIAGGNQRPIPADGTANLRSTRI